MGEIIKINGMSCSHCENRVRKALENEGIEVIRVDAKENLAEIVNAKNIEKEKVIEIIEDSGYEVVV